MLNLPSGQSVVLRCCPLGLSRKQLLNLIRPRAHTHTHTQTHSYRPFKLMCVQLNTSPPRPDLRSVGWADVTLCSRALTVKTCCGFTLSLSKTLSSFNPESKEKMNIEILWFNNIKISHLKVRLFLQTKKIQNKPNIWKKRFNSNKTVIIKRKEKLMKTSHQMNYKLCVYEGRPHSLHTHTHRHTHRHWAWRLPLCKSWLIHVTADLYNLITQSARRTQTHATMKTHKTFTLMLEWNSSSAFQNIYDSGDWTHSDLSHKCRCWIFDLDLKP